MDETQKAKKRHRKRRRRPLVHTKKKNLDSVRAEINVTPLVDVVLVLLIIFMVVGELLARGKKVNDPETENHAKSQDKGKEAIVVMDIKGKLYLDREPAEDTADLRDRIEQFWKTNENADQKVFIKADRGLSYKKVRELVMEMSKLDRPLELATTEKRKK